jgi:hypothetical protein
MTRHRARLPVPAGPASIVEVLAIPGGGQDFSFASRNIQPPAGHYIDRDDNLSISWWSSINPTAFEVRGRILVTGGKVREVRSTITSPAGNARQLVQQFQGLTPGFLLDLACFPAAGVITTRGQVFVSVGLARGPAGAPFGTRVLVQGYLENFIALQWPGTPILGFLDGVGNIRYIHGATPAAGTDSVETVPTGARWSVQFYDIGFSCSGAALNRNVSLQARVGGVNVGDAITLVQQTAGQVGFRYTWQPAGPLLAIQAVSVNPNVIYPKYQLSAGHQLVTHVYMMDAADQLTAPDYVVEEWLQP